MSGVRELVAAYRQGQRSPVAVIEAALARIEAAGHLNAFSLLDAEGALAAAQASARRWRAGSPAGCLDGVPVTIKDMNAVAGWPTRNGSLVASTEPEAADTPPVARLREQGAIFLGKTTTPEYGWQAVTDSPLTGITRNPWDATLTPGGSSGGAAVAAALDLGSLHLGGDGGGSIRIPAALSGVFGIKPSFGRVPRYPQHSPLRLTQAGPLTRTVDDAALMLAVIATPDPRDWMALPPETGDYFEAGGIAGWRIAWAPELGGAEPEPPVLAGVEAAVAVLAELGADVRRIEDPIGPRAELFKRYWRAAQAAAQGHRTPAERARMDPGLVALIEAGERMSYPDFAAAMRERIRLGETLSALLNDHDLLVTPSLPVAAFPAGQGVPEPTRMDSWIDWVPYSYPFNLSGQPAASCPCGFTGAGLPVGLQIVGPLYGDARVLRACRAFEAAQPFTMPVGPAAPEQP